MLVHYALRLQKEDSDSEFPWEKIAFSSIQVQCHDQESLFTKKFLAICAANSGLDSANASRFCITPGSWHDTAQMTRHFICDFNEARWPNSSE